MEAIELCYSGVKRTMPRPGMFDGAGAAARGAGVAAHGVGAEAMARGRRMGGGGGGYIREGMQKVGEWEGGGGLSSHQPSTTKLSPAHAPLKLVDHLYGALPVQVQCTKIFPESISPR